MLTSKNNSSVAVVMRVIRQIASNPEMSLLLLKRFSYKKLLTEKGLYEYEKTWFVTYIFQCIYAIYSVHILI